MITSLKYIISSVTFVVLVNVLLYLTADALTDAVNASTSQDRGYYVSSSANWYAPIMYAFWLIVVTLIFAFLAFGCWLKDQLQPTIVNNEFYVEHSEFVLRQSDENPESTEADSSVGPDNEPDPDFDKTNNT